MTNKMEHPKREKRLSKTRFERPTVAKAYHFCTSLFGSYTNTFILEIVRDKYSGINSYWRIVVPFEPFVDDVLTDIDVDVTEREGFKKDLKNRLNSFGDILYGWKFDGSNLNRYYYTCEFLELLAPELKKPFNELKKAFNEQYKNINLVENVTNFLDVRSDIFDVQFYDFPSHRLLEVIVNLAEGIEHHYSEWLANNKELRHDDRI